MLSFCVIITEDTAMKKMIPLDLIIRYLSNTITEEDIEQLLKWKSRNSNEHLLADIQNVWNAITKRTSSYNPDKERNWMILAYRLHLSGNPTHNQTTIRTPSINLYIASAVAFILLIISFYIGSILNTEKPVELTYSTYSGKSKVSLPDGSEVWLHNNTTLKYPSIFEKNLRKVTLIGQAFFKVAKNTDAPFVVISEELETKVTGTQFNILAYPDSEEIRISLIEGSVHIRSKLNEQKLHKNEDAIYDKKSKELKMISGIDSDNISIWTKNRIHFEKKSLMQITESLSTWYGVEIEIDSVLARKQFYTFTLKNEPLEEILRLMNRINPIRYTFDENNKLTISEERTKSNQKTNAYE